MDESSLSTKDQRKKLQDEITKATEAFLKNGGKVKTIGHGLTEAMKQEFRRKMKITMRERMMIKKEKKC